MTSFVDLFAGLGGFRIGLENNGFHCVHSADNNKHASQVYELNFGEPSYGDVTQINATQLPDMNIVCGGFPCQPFSKAGRTLGFEDTRGTLFFDICRIVEQKQPEVVFLENVRNLATHDKGNTLKVIISSLENLGYHVSTRLLNAADFGVPQSRERIIIIASKKQTFDFDAVETKPRVAISTILEHKPDDQFTWLKEEDYTLIDPTIVRTQKRTGLRFVGFRNKNTRVAGVIEANLHHSRTHKQPNRIYSSEGTHPTLSAGEKSGRYFIQTPREDGTLGVRALTLREGLRLFGYPDSYQLTGAVGEQWARIGNSICVPMVEALGVQIKQQLL